MIRFLAPEWILFLPVMVFLGWYLRRCELWKPLRAASLLLLMLALMQPELKRYQDGMDLWLLVDRSASASEAIEPHLPEWEGIIRSAKGREDRLNILDFADGAIPRNQSDSNILALDKAATRTALAIRQAMLLGDPDRLTRILLLTDGYATDALEELRQPLLNSGIALDYRLQGDTSRTDYRVASFSVPQRSQVSEPFLLDIDIEGTADTRLPYTITRGDATIATGNVDIRGGRARLRFTDRPMTPGAFQYTVTINPANDTVFENNAKSQWIDIEAGPRVLLVTAYNPDPLAAVLIGAGIHVDAITDYQRLDIGRLNAARAVIINNVPAHLIPAPFLSALDFYVRGQAGGLLMAGGKHSFGSGGYFNSPIDELLPVSMDLRQEHRKLAVAMAIVLDRSGSMGAIVSSAGNITKMDMANTGAATAVELLGDSDQISIIAVDSSPHVIVPMTQVGPRRGDIIHRAQRVASMGGGIYVYTGLKEAWKQLKDTQVGQRHIILFSDAADSEEPGNYKSLVNEMKENSTTVSVIGLGSPDDPDADFLKDIATRGNGRIFFNTDPANLPALFTQETVTVARSAFIDEPVAVRPTAGWLEISSKTIPWLSMLDGYNLSYLREGATSAANSDDEYKAPLTAFWQRGAGRTAAVSFPLGGDFSTRARNWPAYGDLTQTLVRWLMGEDTPPGIGLKTRIHGDTLHVDLFYDDTWEGPLGKAPPHAYASTAGMDERQNLVWERIRPGHFRASATMDVDKPVRGAIKAGKTVLPFGPLLLGKDTEWQTDPVRIRTLKNLSGLTGGKERLNLASVWEDIPSKRYASLKNTLLALCLLAFLADALLTRLGIRLRPRR